MSYFLPDHPSDVFFERWKENFFKVVLILCNTVAERGGEVGRLGDVGSLPSLPSFDHFRWFDSKKKKFINIYI